PRAERLAWISGFTGSAGLALVTAEAAVLFVDGRYTLQAAAQADGALWTVRHLVDEPATDWMAANLPAGARLGHDPWLHPPATISRYAAACARAGAELVAVETNPLDAVWDDQPPPPLAPVTLHPAAFTGRDEADKRRDVAADLAARNEDAAVLTAPDSIAWLLNLRGGDVPCTPVALAFAVLHADASLDLFMDARKLLPVAAATLGEGVRIAAPEDLGPALDSLGAAQRTVRVDADASPAWVLDRLNAAGATVARGPDPCLMPRACKNAAERDGTRAAHRRDGAALSRFLAWLDATAPGGAVTEMAAAERLLDCRRDNAHFRGLSFDTIAGSGPNGAIVHYRVTPATDRHLADGDLFLVDSGGQYLDGTTDVTRTVAVGAPGAEQRDRFTRVLKGHIALATARFPLGTTGSQLDALARRPLWAAGLDFDHGTGHGVGSYLSVHEGPHRISKVPNRVALKPGMIVSNEPGYYRTGAYGIRIENLVMVVESPDPADTGRDGTGRDGTGRDGTGKDRTGDNRPMLAFETLTLAPIDRRLVDPALLDADETAWLNAYHARVFDTLSPQVDGATRDWLAAMTAPL
ncbi:MAG: aminopeptidase P family protein, partial [Rhodobacterales bacterium]|nr:aminopeptidase P family protein [Rhodobacterales bacterium]